MNEVKNAETRTAMKHSDGLGSSEATTLLPCPFCGGPATHVPEDGYMSETVGCEAKDCPAWPSVAGSNSIALWNTRAALSERKADTPEPPDLPEPAFWIAEESKRHGMYPAYRSEQAREKYGGEGVWIGHYSRKQVWAVLQADRKARVAASRSGSGDRE